MDLHSSSFGALLRSIVPSNSLHRQMPDALDYYQSAGIPGYQPADILRSWWRHQWSILGTYTSATNLQI
jgi:hypothetical protein